MARTVALFLACAACAAALSAPVALKTRVAISEGECARLFGRLADKLLLLDVEGAGEAGANERNQREGPDDERGPR
jgi:hypothetical protein